jgi:hypothetical protein
MKLWPQAERLLPGQKTEALAPRVADPNVEWRIFVRISFAGMHITSIASQLRVTDLERALRFYTEVLGFEVEFRFEEFYAGIVAGRLACT